jgi:hypothetical protein
LPRFERGHAADTALDVDTAQFFDFFTKDDSFVLGKTVEYPFGVFTVDKRKKPPQPLPFGKRSFRNF